MRVYVVVIDDRHSDIGVRTFASREKASRFADKTAREFSFDGTYSLHEYKEFTSYNYSTESDKVMVFESEVDGGG